MPTHIRLREFGFDRVDLVTAGDNPTAKVALWKKAPPSREEERVPDNPKLPEGVEKLELSDDQKAAVTKALEAANKTADEAVEKAQELEKKLQDMEKRLEKKDDGKPEDPIAKVLAQVPEEVAKAFKTEREAMEKKIADAEKVAKEEREARVNKEYVAKAQEFQAVAKASELGPIMKDANEKLGEDAYKAFEQILRSASEIARSSRVFSVVGSDAEGQGEGSQGAYTKLAKAADKLREEEPKLTAEQALAQIYESRPELVAEYQAEIRREVR